MIILYQFKCSHFCEKARAALTYKKLDYQVINVLPGFHIKKMKRISNQHSVPVIVDDQNVIANSSDIITYLDQQYPAKPLTPSDAVFKEQAAQWEQLADEKIGPSVRVIGYAELFNYPKYTTQFLTDGCPWYSYPLFRLLYPKLKQSITRYYKINPENIGKQTELLNDTLHQISERLKAHHFLAGEHFSRADLAVATLLRTAFSKLTLESDPSTPNPFADIQKQYPDIAKWIDDIYQEYLT